MASTPTEIDSVTIQQQERERERRCKAVVPAACLNCWMIRRRLTTPPILATERSVFQIESIRIVR